MSIKARNLIAYLAVKYKQVWDDIYNAIITKEPVDNEIVEETLSTLKGDYITIIDDDYPKELKHIYRPPFVIFLNNEDQNKFNDISSKIYCTKYNLGNGLSELPYEVGLQEAIKLNLQAEFELAFNMLTNAGFDEALATAQALRFIKDYETNMLEGDTLA